MSVIAAASGFVVHLLTVTVVRSQNGWGVSYTSSEICAFRGSTVDINCTYKYPSRWNNQVNTVQETFWFINVTKEIYYDLKTDPEYSGRVEYLCENNMCTLRISNLRESDSAVYKFRFTTNQTRGTYFGALGVTLSVTDPQLQVHMRRSTANQYSTWKELTCNSSCQLPDHLSYVWYNKNELVGRKKIFHLQHFETEDRYHCSIEGHERFPSPPLDYPSDAPKVPTVSVSSHGEIMEGSSVNLTCSSDAKPAAKYTWYKRSGDKQVQPPSEETQFVFSSIRWSDSGDYYCTAENELGRSSANISITVKLESWKSALIGSAAAVFLAVTLLSVFLLIRKKRNSQQSADPGHRLDHSEQRQPNQSEENCDLHYASVHFMKSKTDPIYSNVGSAEPSNHKEAEEVAYASVNFNRSAQR